VHLFQWRNTEKWAPPAADDGGDGAGAPAAVADAGPPLALIDDFLDKMGQDEYLAATLLTGAHMARAEPSFVPMAGVCRLMGTCCVLA
jgi:hypothetical protein